MDFGTLSGMPIPLELLFAKRLKEEKEKRGLSDNALAKLAKVGQRSVSRILLPVGHKDRQVPALDLVDKLAAALELPAWYLMVDAGQVKREVISPPVLHQDLPGYPRTFTPPSDSGKKSESPTRKPRHRRNK